MITERLTLSAKTEGSPTLEFTIPSSVLLNSEVVDQVNEISTKEVKLPETVVQMVVKEVENDETDTYTQEELFQQKVLISAEENEKGLKENVSNIAETVSNFGSLLGAFGSLVSLAGAVCPHCAVAAASSLGNIFGLAGGGHWHSDGTYHETGHDGPEEESRFNPFEWLKVAA